MEDTIAISVTDAQLNASLRGVPLTQLELRSLSHQLIAHWVLGMLNNVACDLRAGWPSARRRTGGTGAPFTLAWILTELPSFCAEVQTPSLEVTILKVSIPHCSLNPLGSPESHVKRIP